MNAGAVFALTSLGAFLCGAMPFSVWLGKLIAKRDVRDYGDGNPGAMNAFRAGSALLGLAVLLLDVTKGVLPVAFAVDSLGYTDWRLAVIAVMPVAGHAFSPFLRFRGGKGLAVTLGTWIALTVWRIPLVAVTVIVVATLLLRQNSWAVALTLLALGVAIALWLPNAWLEAALLGQSAVIIWKHRTEFREPPRPREAATGKV